MSPRLLRYAVIASLLDVSGSTVGCGSSPTGPSSVLNPVVRHLEVTLVSPERGLAADAVTIRGEAFQFGATVAFDGVAAKKVTLNTFQTLTAVAPYHPPGPVDVVVTNPNGERATLTAGFTYDAVTLAASPSRVDPEGQLTLSFSAPSGRGCNGGGDWIAIYRVGDPDNTGASNGHSDLWYEHTCGATAGSYTLKAPLAPGEYEFRYLVGDTAAARSNPVIVSGSARP